MWTATDVARRLRAELGFERLVVKLLPACRPDDKDRQGRWAAFVRVPTLTGRRDWPFSLTDDGTVVPGKSAIREVGLVEECVYVHEGPNGEYLDLEPNLFRWELAKRDTHHRNLPRELKETVQKKRTTINKKLDDDARERSKYYRKAFARVMRGEESGL